MKFVEPARNYGLSKATGKWIILLDPDERLPKTLKNELLRLTKRHDIDFVRMPRQNICFGKWLKYSRSWPDYLIRFFKKGAVSWQKQIHSQPITKGNGHTLLDSEKLAIRHYNYDTVTSFITRAVRYSGIQADELKQDSYKLKISDFILKPVQEFNSRFFAGQGYKDGTHGLIFCLLQAFSVGLIYIRLWEKNGTDTKALSKESFISASQEAIYEYSHWFTNYFNQESSKNPFSKIIARFRQLVIRATKGI